MSNATSFSNVPPVPLPSGGLLPVAGAIAPQASPPTQRRTVSAQRFYTPPGSNRGGTQLVGAVPGTYGMVAQCGRASVEEPCDMGNVVVIDSVVAGVGTSTLAALLARELSERGLKCVLVDADLQGGGLDVLLGVENEDGSRFGKSALRLAISTAKRYCGSCQSGMVCHCWHAILGKPKIRNRGKCKRAFMRYRRCEAWSSSIWGNGTDCRI